MTTKIKLSYSRVSKFISCTAAYKYSYVDGIRFEAGEPLFIGNVVHKFIEQVNKEGNGGFTEEQVAELVDIWVEEKKSEYVYEVPLENLKRQIVDLCWFWHNSDRVRGILKPEEQLLVPLRNPKTGEVVEGVELDAWIDGYIDEGHIIDYKTSGKSWEEGKHIMELQPKFYALSMGVGQERDSIDFTHEIIVKTQMPKLQHMSQRLDIKDAMTAFHICRAYLKWLPLGLFVPNRGMQCKWCDHVHRCVNDY